MLVVTLGSRVPLKSVILEGDDLDSGRRIVTGDDVAVLRGSAPEKGL
jgi:hypothetical protein